MKMPLGIVIVAGRVLAAGAVALCSASATPAAPLNVPVAVRVLSFLQPPPSGVTPVGIVFEPGNAVSEGDAAALERSIGGGLSAGRALVRTRRIPVTALSGMAGLRAAFVTGGLRNEQAGVAAAAARLSVVTITSDLDCVAAARCIVGISSTPRVQITVSRAAARSANIHFGSAFLMLVKEI